MSQVLRADAAAKLSLPIVEDHNGLLLELIAERSGFAALESDWDDLMGRCKAHTTAFQTFNWHWHWVQHYLCDQCSTPMLVVARRQGRVEQIWPLVLDRHLTVKRLSFMGEPVSQYGDIIADPGSVSAEDLLAAWRFLTRNAGADILRLRKVRAGSTVALLADAISAVKSNETLAPHVELSGAANLEEAESHYSTKAKRNRRRLARRLGETHNLTFERHREGATASDLIEVALKLKEAWLTDRGLVSAAIGDAKTMAFFRSAAASTERPTGLTVSALRLDGQPAAIQIGFVCGGHYALHINVFDLAHEKSGVGVLLTEQNIRDTFAEGLATFDFLGPADNYKFDWANKSVATADWTLPLTLKGVAYGRIYLDLIRTKGKQALSALPSPLRRTVASLAGHGSGNRKPSTSETAADA